MLLLDALGGDGGVAVLLDDREAFVGDGLLQPGDAVGIVLGALEAEVEQRVLEGAQLLPGLLVKGGERGALAIAGQREPPGG